MTPRDKAILEFLASRKGIIWISLCLTAAGIIFILFTGRYELSLFVIAGILPWVEYWFRRRNR